MPETNIMVKLPIKRGKAIIHRQRAQVTKRGRFEIAAVLCPDWLSSNVRRKTPPSACDAGPGIPQDPPQESPTYHRMCTLVTTNCHTSHAFRLRTRTDFDTSEG